MRIRRTLYLGAAVALTAACSKTEPIMLSSPSPESPSTQNSSATDSPDSTAARGPDGRYIARCTTEADGQGGPGETHFTDGSVGVTDYCLRRFYIGVQPQPGAVYVPDDQAGLDAPSSSAPATGDVPAGSGTTKQPQRPEGDYFALGQPPRDNLGANTAATAGTSPSTRPGEHEAGRDGNGRESQPGQTGTTQEQVGTTQPGQQGQPGQTTQPGQDTPGQPTSPEQSPTLPTIPGVPGVPAIPTVPGETTTPGQNPGPGGSPTDGQAPGATNGDTNTGGTGSTSAPATGDTLPGGTVSPAPAPSPIAGSVPGSSSLPAAPTPYESEFVDNGAKASTDLHGSAVPDNAGTAGAGGTTEPQQYPGISAFR